MDTRSVSTHTDALTAMLLNRYRAVTSTPKEKFSQRMGFGNSQNRAYICAGSLDAIESMMKKGKMVAAVPAASAA